MDSLAKLIQARDNGGLTHLAIETDMSDSEGKKLLHDLKCKSITTIEFKNCGFDSFDFVNPLLAWKMIAEKQIFVIIDVSGYFGGYDSVKVLSLFKQLYQNVSQLFVQQVALDIKITCGNVKDSKVLYSCLSTYSSYFENEEFLSKYNKPKHDSN